MEMKKKKLFLVLIAAFAPGAALASELCVSCAGPEAVYRCEPEGFGADASRAAWVCVTELAKLEGHKSCAVDRRAAGPCDGPIKIVRRELAPGAATAPIDAAAPPLDIPEDTPPEAPSTVADALKNAGRSANEQVQNAGAAVGAATQKAWNCLASLGAKC